MVVLVATSNQTSSHETRTHEEVANLEALALVELHMKHNLTAAITLLQSAYTPDQPNGLTLAVIDERLLEALLSRSPSPAAVQILGAWAQRAYDDLYAKSRQSPTESRVQGRMAAARFQVLARVAEEAGM